MLACPCDRLFRRPKPPACGAWYVGRLGPPRRL